jgi:glycosyltransferase involved in cell wall biosynthesis
MRSALMICPEAPYPVAGGGPLRTACLLEYLAPRYSLDLVLFQEPGAPDPRAAIPPGLVQDAKVIDLPYHSKRALPRVLRNLRRYARKQPPLMDRFAGFEIPIARRYDIAIVEHFWCAPYLHQLRSFCDRMVLDLHNVESILLDRSAQTRGSVEQRILRTFAEASRRYESELLPQFNLVLATSEEDRNLVGTGFVWPNTIPLVPLPEVEKRDEIIFSGNMAYLPNIDAAHYFAAEIWPVVSAAHPTLTWRLAGRNPEAVKLSSYEQTRVSGPMIDAIAEIATARASVAPLLAGSGTRFKIIEAWAAGTPVISTTIGAEGLGAKHGEHLLIADDPTSFASALLSVLNDRRLAQELASAGRKLYESRFTWPSAWKMLEAAGL